MTLPGFNELAPSDPDRTVSETLAYIKRRHPGLGDISTDPKNVPDAVWVRIMQAKWQTRQEQELAELKAQVALMRGKP